MKLFLSFEQGLEKLKLNNMEENEKVQEGLVVDDSGIDFRAKAFS